MTVSLIRISPNRRTFVYAAGNPFFWLGDTACTPPGPKYAGEDAILILDGID